MKTGRVEKKRFERIEAQQRVNEKVGTNKRREKTRNQREEKPRRDKTKPQKNKIETGAKEGETRSTSKFQIQTGSGKK